ncbi:MAG: tRNA (N6-threonylcarbamoyladenosine(37)-N6)-methyltransferase TrmO [Lachnospiraceae bacterium]|nr:tRNA (N6-threonylcarbamoyladenosine(37)-N6)-methyltransferase TrmO [Lachnospiraceae bacterium]
MRTEKDNSEDTLKIIGYIRTDFPEKFGIPRQAGLVKDIEGYIELLPPYNDMKALEGIEDYNYLWILWKFEVDKREELRVRPPVLGGNTYKGVFATRSPFRPNHIAMSSVKFKEVKEIPGKGPVIVVTGIDMRDNTPVYDIKPYLKYADSHEDANNGFSPGTAKRIKVEDEKGLLETFGESGSNVREILSLDPRPAFHNDPDRLYGLTYKDKNITFSVSLDTLFVHSVE